MSEPILKNKKLPSSWVCTELENVAQIQGGYAFKSNDYSKSGIFILRTLNITTDGLINRDNPVFLPKSLYNKYKNFALKNNDILFVMVGATMGKVGYVTNLVLPTLLNQNMWLIRSQDIDSRFLFYLLKRFSTSFLKNSVGSARPFVKRNDFRKMLIPIPTIIEQKRIVAKIEELFSLINENYDLLESIKLKIPILRNSIFKKAFSGEYTTKWRKFQNTHISKEELIKQVFTEVSKFKKEINTKHLEKVNLSPLPPSWSYLSLDSLTSKIVDGTHFAPEFVESGISFISAKDIKNGIVNFDTCKFISKEKHDELSKRCNPEYGDVLMSKSGTIGRTAVVDTHVSFSLCESASLLKPLSKFLSSKYLSWFLEYYVKMHLRNQGLRGVGVMHFQLIDIKKIPIPLTSLDEQKEIVNILEFELSILNNILDSIENLISKNKQLAQSILKQAFEGKLIPQDPDDESAEILLRKITEEKQKIVSKNKRGKKNDK